MSKKVQQHQLSQEGLETLVDNVQEIVGNNLKRIRLERGFSLAEVSAMSMVSQSMLSEIERGLKSPSITTLYRICAAIHISLEALLHRPLTPVEIGRGSHPIPTGNEMVYILHKYSTEHNLEVDKVYIPPQTQHPANSHGKDVWEYVMVLDGEFTLILDDATYRISKGESLRFLADCHHIYANETNQDLWLYNVILYNREHN